MVCSGDTLFLLCTIPGTEILTPGPPWLLGSSLRVPGGGGGGASQFSALASWAWKKRGKEMVDSGLKFQVQEKMHFLPVIAVCCAPGEGLCLLLQTLLLPLHPCLAWPRR